MKKTIRLLQNGLLTVVLILLFGGTQAKAQVVATTPVEIEKMLQGYKPVAGGITKEMFIRQLRMQDAKGLKFSTAGAKGGNLSAAQLSASEKLKKDGIKTPYQTVFEKEGPGLVEVIIVAVYK